MRYDVSHITYFLIFGVQGHFSAAREAHELSGKSPGRDAGTTVGRLGIRAQECCREGEYREQTLFDHLRSKRSEALNSFY